MFLARIFLVISCALVLISCGPLLPAHKGFVTNGKEDAHWAKGKHEAEMRARITVDRAFESPTGETYEAEIPDTLDLADRAALALNGLGGTIDPALGYQTCFLVFFNNRTPWMQHHSADTSMDPKFAESFPLMRIISGSGHHAELERRFRVALLSRIQDGHYWKRHDPATPWSSSYNQYQTGQIRDEDVSMVLAQARMIRALLVWREIDGRTEWDDYIRELVSGLNAVVIKTNDYAYYPNGGFGEPFSFPRSGWQKTGEPQEETEGGEGSVLCYQGHQIYALTKWYLASGELEARDLAARLVRFCMKPKFWGGVPDERGKTSHLPFWIGAQRPVSAINGAEMGHWWSHFHARCIALRGILEYAVATHDMRALEFVRRAYEYSWSLGIPRIGWINSFPTRLPFSEGCALGDLIALGIRLSDAGAGDYWDDVDAVVRNQLAEGQICDSQLLAKAISGQPDRRPDEIGKYPGQDITENVATRALGTFFHCTTPGGVPGDWWLHSMSCCTGNGSQGLYYAWEGIVREQGETTVVNLLLNRAARSLDLDSYLPYQGKVVIHNKTARRLAIRIPSWVERDKISVDTCGKSLPQLWMGNYLVLEDVKPNDTITLVFPIREATVQYTANPGVPGQEQVYQFLFRGSTCVDVTPRETAPGAYPFYLREGMRQEKAPMKKTKRFIADKVVTNW